LSSNPAPAASGAPAPAAVNVVIDGRPCSVPRGTLIIQAIQQAGRAIPYYCYHSKLAPAGACRVCLVQVEGPPVAPRGPMVTTACTTPVFEGLKIETMAAAAQEARRQVIAFLLANHPLDCPICDKGGECDLQDFTLAYGPGVSRFAEQKILRRKADDLGPFLVLDQERCIMCQRCVRYEREILGEQNLVLKQRGDRTVIDTPRTGEPYAGYFSGNNTELCPVGALTSRTYRFKARPWDVRPVPSVCEGCSLGCNVSVQLRGERLVRILWRDNASVDGGWLCDRGRYGFGHTASPQRLTTPLLRRGAELAPATWEEALAAAARGLKQAKGSAVLGGGRLTDEDALLLSEFARVALGTNDVDWRVGFQGVAAPAAIGCREAAVTDLDRADVVVLVDTAVEDEAPVLDLRLRRRAARGGAVIDVGPLRGFRHGPASWIPCLPEELPQRLAALGDRIAAAQAPVLVWNGRGGEPVAAALRSLAAPLLLVGEFPNGRGAEAAGLLPDLLPGYRALAEAAGMRRAWGGRPAPATPGRGARAILEAAAQGALGGLYLVGANPVRTFPDGGLAVSAIERVGFLVVQDLFLTEAAEAADVVLPARGPLEREGHVTNLAGLTQVVARAAQGPAGARPDGEILRLLAEAMGVPLRGGVPPAPERPARPTLPPAGEAAGAPPGPGAWRLLLRPRLFAGGGTARFDPQLEPVREEAVLRLHPADATALGAADGAAVHVGSGRSTLRATLRLDHGVCRGCCVLPAHTAANRLGPTGTLTLAPASEGRAG
jgi:NADH-quinone oxidoreductase subunit G